MNTKIPKTARLAATEYTDELIAQINEQQRKYIAENPDQKFFPKQEYYDMVFNILKQKDYWPKTLAEYNNPNYVTNVMLGQIEEAIKALEAKDLPESHIKKFYIIHEILQACSLRL
jgi:hypothetical protein